jgi:hypothetical protein
VSINPAMRPISLLLTLLAVACLTGCNTFDRRAQQKPAVFASLSPETRERLKNKSIQVGDTPDMVFIALGRADEVQTTTTAAGETLTWTYTRYWQEYQGQAYAGVRPRTVSDPKTGATTVYYEQIYQPVYASREQPVLRITFSAGKVSVIERAKD